MKTYYIFKCNEGRSARIHSAQTAVGKSLKSQWLVAAREHIEFDSYRWNPGKQFTECGLYFNTASLILKKEGVEGYYRIAYSS